MNMSLPGPLIVFFLSMLPMTELRGSIPLALTIYQLSPLEAFVWASLGNFVPVLLLVWGLERVSNYLSRHSSFFNRFFSWLFERTRRRHNHRFEVWGSLALVFLVAIPLPLTGGWTGALASFVFGLPIKKALPLIFLGLLLAGVIVVLTTLVFQGII